MKGIPRRPLPEALTLYGITLVITVGLTLLQGSVSWLRAYLLVFVAATFLYLPIELLHRRGEEPADLGIHREQPWRHLRLALLVMLITFPPYLIGFHYWQTDWLGQAPAAEARFDRWPVELRDPPEVKATGPAEVRLWTEDDTLVLRWHLPAGQALVAELESDGAIGVAGMGGAGSQGHDRGLTVSGRSDGWARFDVPGQRLKLSLEAGGDRLPPSRLRLGTALIRAEEMPVTFERGYWWLLNLILMQLLLVALPEEVFYRGYLQSRFDRVFEGEIRVLGVMVNPWSLLLTSTLFAIGHYLTIPNPARLAVFFPSLLFGWMRRATGGVMSPILYHAACNLLVEVASVFYAPA